MKTFDSWNSIDDIKFYKIVDVTVINEKMSVIPQGARYLFDYTNTDKDITLVYKGKEFSSCIYAKTYMNVTRVYIRLNEIIKNMEKKLEIDDLLYFTRLERNKYLVEVKSTDCEITSDVESVIVEKTSEGRRVAYYTTRYERSDKNRELAIKIHKAKCYCCDFDFEEKYGKLGKGFIEVHHIKPLFSVNEQVIVDPRTDLVCLCSNCHRMIHRKRTEILTPDELKKIIKEHEVKA